MTPRQPSEDTPTIPEIDGGSPAQPRIGVEEARSLKDWARKSGIEGNTSFANLRRARNHRRIRTAVLAGIAAVGLGVGIANPGKILDYTGQKVGEVSSWWKAGFNDAPRGPYPGITLKDPKEQRKLTCLSERFSDEASLFPNIGDNKWAQKNCADVDADLAQDPSYQDDPYIILARRKNVILRAAHLQTDAPQDRSVVEWYNNPLGMYVHTREERLEKTAAEQKRTTGTTNFTIE